MAANIPTNGIATLHNLMHYDFVFLPIYIAKIVYTSQDRNQDDDELISITEFSMFVFPESSSALEEDKIRIQKLKEEVNSHMIYFFNKLKLL